ncbi:hypothetical protein ACFO7V_16920 [Glutamicibacter bergerei]|uniref:Uncharacterized protein n=1 Tax=Glutamicibacter bergerei TaxID=256702 RepID=A0ABV9MRK6_9MICC|nr:hypothetical protein [Micrococcaceae bacterium]
MRLQQPIYVDKRVLSIKLRIVATDVPTSAAVLVTDVQLQAGEQPTGVVPNPAEVGTTIGRAQYRNGVINPGLQVVALSNADKAAPVYMRIRGKGETRVGAYKFGALNGVAEVDGLNHYASQGYGRAPIITERQDLTLNTVLTGRAHLQASWNERS